MDELELAISKLRHILRNNMEKIELVEEMYSLMDRECSNCSLYVDGSCDPDNKPDKPFKGFDRMACKDFEVARANAERIEYLLEEIKKIHKETRGL